MSAQADTPPVFMSAEHVVAMNDRLAGASDVLAAAAALDRDVVVAYRLTDGPDGHEVHWQMRFDRASGVSFALGPPDGGADVTVVSDWAGMVRGARAQRQGRTPEVTPRLEGDAGALAEVGQAFGAASAVAVVDVTFPDL